MTLQRLPENFLDIDERTWPCREKYRANAPPLWISPLASIHHKQLRARLGVGAMGFCVIRNLIAHSRFEDKNTAII
ncbi:hypothetical protein Pcaca05_17560 [Pectobacterium carotovorum subsp. carotovorum]|nr:hypothetical protein Pcaca05_17560 [Pectobacterium carotovorum subsp. carotovorum]